jgi:hypothetical protein
MGQCDVRLGAGDDWSGEVDGESGSTGNCRWSGARDRDGEMGKWEKCG